MGIIWGYKIIFFKVIAWDYYIQCVFIVQVSWQLMTQKQGAIYVKVCE